MAIDLTPNIDDTITATRWRSLKLYNGYRLFISLLFLVSQNEMLGSNFLQNNQASLFSSLVWGYFIFSCTSAIFTWLEKPKIDFNLPAQIILDIAFIVVLMYAQQDGIGGIGLLLIITIASASLISEGRLALFYAALATIGILLEQSYSLLTELKAMGNYSGAVMLSLSCFATAWLAHSLAKRVQQSELLASQRGLDVKNMAQVNALITHEMQDGVLVVDQHLAIKHHNMQAKRLLGFESDNNEISHWQEMSLTSISAELSEMIRNWMQNHAISAESKHSNLLKLNVLSRELRLRFLPVAENRSQGAVIFIEDWSQMQTQAHQVKLAALGRLTANIAHEIRNPLSAISHANQLLQEEEGSNPASKRMLQIISDNVQRLDQIIKDVLELNRRDRTNQEMIRLEHFLADFYTQFCAVEKIPPHCFELALANKDTVIAFDRRHLNQILWNLCKNGWRHSKQSENSLKLTVSVSAKMQDAQIEISDDGEGIPENVRSHLFEPFFTTEKTGTGLGLYIARELADANGAKLQLKPLAQHDSAGSQFIIYIKKA